MFDSEFQEALDERAEAIGAAMVDGIDTPLGLVATYWATLGLAAAIKATIEDVEVENRGSQALRDAAHQAMSRVADRWNAIKREPFVIPLPDGRTMHFLGGSR